MARRAVLVLALAFSFAPGLSQAGHVCDPKIVILSYPLGVNSNAVKCVADSSDERDGRLINPGSNEVVLRYTVDFGAGVPTLDGRFHGLGLVKRDVTLTRQQINPGTPFNVWVYQSARIALPASNPMGCLTGSRVFNKGAHNEYLESNSFHTLNATCPS